MGALLLTETYGGGADQKSDVAEKHSGHHS